MVAALGGLVGLGAGTSFVGRAVVVVVGGFGLLGRGIAPSLSSDDSKENFRFGLAGWGGLGFAWGGEGFGAVVVDASPPLPPPPPPRSLSECLFFFRVYFFSILFRPWLSCGSGGGQSLSGKKFGQ